MRQNSGVQLEFSGTVIEWRGPAPHHFVALSPDAVDALTAVSARVSYGWGCIPVVAELGGSEWKTSVLPKDGGYLLPLRLDVRKAEQISLGDVVTVELFVDC